MPLRRRQIAARKNFQKRKKSKKNAKILDSDYILSENSFGFSDKDYLSDSSNDFEENNKVYEQKLNELGKLELIKKIEKKIKKNEKIHLNYHKSLSIKI